MRFLGRVAKFWLLVACLCIGVYFAITNQNRVIMQLPPWIEHVTMPGYMAYTACFVFGALFMSLFFSLDSIRKSLEIRRLKKRLRELGEPVEAVRATAGDPPQPLEPLP